MYPPTTSDAAASAGFSLFEALAALAVIAAGMGAIGSLTNASIRATLVTERHLSDVETARKIIVGMPSRADLSDAALSGALDDHHWQIEASPYPVSRLSGSSSSVWEPETIVLRVGASSGGAIEVDTIRLRKRASQ